MRLSETNGFVFDFDSTVVKLETFDEILNIALDGNSEREDIMREIEAITNAGMNGDIPLQQSLQKRLQSACITAEHLGRCKELIADSVSEGIAEIIDYLRVRQQQVFIVSGGFTELILPVAQQLNIPADHCFANTFLMEDSIVTGIDFDNPLSNNGGKTATIQTLRECHPDIAKIICIGDGMSDAEPYLAGKADEFWGYFQNQDRPKVRKKASRSFNSSRELLEYLQGFDT